MIRLHGVPGSTNVERVKLALGYKGLPVEHVMVDRADRREVRKVSGQDLVPVLEDDGTVVIDSMEIVRYLDERYPKKPLYPRAQARRAEMFVFVDWFNRVWKRWPNQIATELDSESPNPERIQQGAREMRTALALFDDMLTGRSFLMGPTFSAADVAAFPFLKFALWGAEGDVDTFHQVLGDFHQLGKEHAKLEAWLRRVDRFPRG